MPRRGQSQFSDRSTATTRLLREPLLLRASTLAVAAVLVGTPVTIGSDLAGPTWHVALAEKGGNRGGNPGNRRPRPRPRAR